MPTMPKAHTGVVDMEPHYTPENAPPLSAMASTLGTAQAAATWRKPGTVLPLSKATIGSTFKPFG